MDTSVVPDLNVRQHWIRIGTHGDMYKIVRDPKITQRWSCTCKGWLFRHRKNANFECKHIREIKTKLVDTV